MYDLTRVILVEPRSGPRGDLESLFAGLGMVRLLASCASYRDGADAAARYEAEVVVVDLDADIEAATALIPTVLRIRPRVVVLATSRSREVDLVLRAVRAGAREFLTLPINPEQLREAINRVTPLARPAETPSPRPESQVVAVLGACGGVGCTTLAINLGVVLAEDKTREVVVVDLDLVLGAVDACLDIMPDQTLLDVAQSVARLDDTLLKRSLTQTESGLFVLPSPVTLEDSAKVEPDAVRRVLERLRDCFSVVLLDLGKGLEAHDHHALELADCVLLVVQLEPACLRNCVRLLDYFRQEEGLIDKVRIVANRVGAHAFEVAPKKAEELLRVPMPWLVPNDYRAFSAARCRGVSVVADSPGSRGHRAFQEIAREFGTVDTAPTKSRFGRIAASFF